MFFRAVNRCGCMSLACKRKAKTTIVPSCRSIQMFPSQMRTLSPLTTSSVLLCCSFSRSAFTFSICSYCSFSISVLAPSSSSLLILPFCLFCSLSCVDISSCHFSGGIWTRMSTLSALLIIFCKWLFIINWDLKFMKDICSMYLLKLFWLLWEFSGRCSQRHLFPLYGKCFLSIFIYICFFFQ